jgi:hypothetical protein
MKTPVSEQSHISEYWLGAGVILDYMTDIKIAQKNLYLLRCNQTQTNI